ncbi:MAG: hypothetical protein E6R04_05830 [Spirochaetes bacterium]|nr:MAG: hypothetical protein E6R04_05830 [Spirochaetota bacterium]
MSRQKQQEEQKSELEKLLGGIPGLTSSAYAYNNLKIEPVKTEISSGLYEYRIKFTQMYEYIDLSFETLLALSEIFQTRKIDIGERENWGGCETCDYGSSYQVSVRIGNSPVCFEV